MFKFMDASITFLEPKNLSNYALKRVGIGIEEMYPIAAKAIQNNFYTDDFIKSVETPERAIEVLNQLQPLLSQHCIKPNKNG